MALPHLLDFMQIPASALIALDNRSLHFVLQPVHHLIRLLHILSVSAFFGTIGALDLRLLGWRRVIATIPLESQLRPLLRGALWTTLATGVLLFLYDPVHVGAHNYFSLKILLIGVGIANAVLFHRGLVQPFNGSTLRARHWAGGISLVLWTGVMICACLNTEAAPKRLLLF